MAMKEFKTAAKRADGEDKSDPSERETLTFKHDDREVVSRRPTEPQIAYIISVQSSDTRDDGQMVAGLIDFFTAICDKDTARYFAKRLLDGDDPFDLEDLLDVLGWLLEEWADRPTKPSSGSTSSSGNSGAGSTETASSEASTSGDSNQLVPAT